LIPIIISSELEAPELLKDGDLIMADASEDYEGIGQSIELINVGDKRIVSGTHTFPLRPVEKFAPKYAGYIFSNYNTHKEIKKIATVISVYGISKSNNAKIQLPIPPLPEQKAIADCLSTWDKGIEKLSALIASKKEQKKGLMQGIFSGKLKVENGELIQAKEGENFLKDWKKVRINEISKLGRGRVINKKEIESNLGIYPVYSSQTTNNGIFGYLNTYDFEGEYITWTTDGVNAGSIFYRTGRFNCTNVCGTVKLRKGYDYYFVKSTLDRVAERYVSRTLANAKLMNGVFGTIEILIPSYDEQRTITKVLMVVDKEIELLEKRLEALKIQKKGLMQVLLTGTKRLVES